jgi:hypothetical protein
MKREVRLPTKGYDLLRQQVQAKRGSPTNRDLSDDAPAVEHPEPDSSDNENLGSIAAPAATATHTSDEGRDEKPLPETAVEPARPEVSTPVAAAPERRKPRAAPSARATRSSPTGVPPSETGRVTLKINFTAPASGVFPFYDRVIESMPPRKAVPLLLAKAFDDLEAAAARGESVRLEEYKMERKGERISTSRTMDVTTLEKLRASVDPHDLMRPSSLGAALATSALSRYLRKHG